MAQLTARHRNALSDAMFGLPRERKYPMPDKSHARNAMSRTSQEANAGRLTVAQHAEIVRKAERVLKR